MSQIVVLYDLTAGETSYNTKESSKQAPLRDPPGFISEHSAVQTVHDAESQYNRPAMGGQGQMQQICPDKSAIMETGSREEKNIRQAD